ncbi:Mg2 transporter protein CorA family protein [Gordonia bronchialis DSM 43247]|uniref:Mg2 transporter protein CorA family protein n=1 Tax=Gordonia bronchialis (strain ATCC 25592 / DSM 43247 / BCRC 13721 / JCM 3198 / KCTC 3076 / NBRC 16047 / NCTC 10667) TaxID=526226 RepID=D0L9E3_GORB4|nr:magnesium and cobalt transport protein CorA [Gordonia bronchialis]ACY21131.1 Mg2 transporter protein CorA family protein [Gordonia bronchialis DSM 43247]MCC3323916.1 magnesium and cobalt transport protein CorA [Gordonia bronchialis]QGS27086.1 magnesium transporter [Gordonia bronchialis]UAK40366.1 magnesium and cobalt transport protein CorA [Gordonia bronchialis]STQ64000.1 Magnesium transport protein CorA [Gordonia bronchialis]
MPNLRPGGRGLVPARRDRRPLPRIPVPVARAVVDCAIYIDGVRQPGRISYTDALATVRESGRGFVWLGLHSPDDEQMTGVGEAFGLHELVVEDAVHAHQRPKLEVYDDTQFLVLRTVKYVEHESMEQASEVVETGEIMIFAGADFVVTVRHGDHTHLSGVRRKLEARPELLTLGPTAVMHAIADKVVDSYLAVTDRMEVDVVAIEETVFGKQNRWLNIDPVYLLKREVLELRRAVQPLSAPLARLTDHENPLIPKEIRRHLRDVADHLATVIERVVEYDEVLTSLLDAAAAKVGIQQNTDMRKISAWVAIAAVPTMLAGVYGMNFDHMPELHQVWGYPAVLLFMIATCTTLFFVFRRHHWL